MAFKEHCLKPQHQMISMAEISFGSYSSKSVFYISSLPNQKKASRSAFQTGSRTERTNEVLSWNLECMVHECSWSAKHKHNSRSRCLWINFFFCCFGIIEIDIVAELWWTLLSMYRLLNTCICTLTFESWPIQSGCTYTYISICFLSLY